MDRTRLLLYVIPLLLRAFARAQIQDGRLPGTLAPSHYDVIMIPNIYTSAPPFGFSGNVTIDFDCLEATSSIFLNQYELSIDPDSILLYPDPGDPTQPPQPEWTDLEVSDALQMLELKLTEDLVQGARYVLVMSFTGTMAPPGGWPDGLFYDVYTENGENKYIAGTNFYPRAWMPCFDEPSYKATFSVTVARQSGMVALMNTPLLDQVDGADGWIYDVFETTPVTAPYIVCFFVGAFDYIEIVTSNGIVSRVWSRPDIISAMEFSASSAARMIDWFEDWTQSPYPIAKMDHIAIPSMGGAMENWGLIFYGESALFYDPDLSTENRKSGAAHIIGHELAHQWFGNLVTYAWWDEAWLNEGFASFFEYQPFQDTLGWNGDELHLMDDCWNIMNTDSTNGSQPIRIEIISPWERWDAFSSQAYTKGGCVVRMIRHILGEDTFRRGISKYLAEYAYENAVTDDLFLSLDQQAAIDGITDTDGSPLVLGDKLYPFLNQMGFPVVTASRQSDTLSLQQNQYQNPRGAYQMPPSDYQYEWNVPISLATSSNPDFSSGPMTWMNRENVSECCSLAPDDTWYLLNNNAGGFYRVQYDPDNQQAVNMQLQTNPQVMSVESRAQFVQDTVMLAKAGYSADVSMLDVSAYLDQEDSLLPWSSLRNGLSYPTLMLARFPSTHALMQDYIREQTSPLYDALGWEMETDDDMHMTKLLRVLIMELACTSGHVDCVETARQLYAQWMQEPEANTPVSDLRPVISCSAVAAGGEIEFDFALSLYRQIIDNEPVYVFRPLRDTFLTAMACSTDEAQLQEYIDLTFDLETIPSRDSNAAMTAIASSASGRDVMWRHLQSNWDNNPTPAGVTRGSVLQTVVEGFSTHEDLAEFDGFVAVYPPQDATDRNVYERARNTLLANIAWTDENQKTFDDWLSVQRLASNMVVG